MGIGKDAMKKLRPPAYQGQSKQAERDFLEGNTTVSNKKLELKTHSGGHNCILPRYQPPDAMSDPVVVTRAAETIDSAVMVVGRGREAMFSPASPLSLLPPHPLEESFNER